MSQSSASAVTHSNQVLDSTHNWDTYEWAKADTHNWDTYEWAKADTHNWDTHNWDTYEWAKLAA